MERYPIPNLAAEIHFYDIQDSVQNWTTNIKTLRIAKENRGI